MIKTLQNTLRQDKEQFTVPRSVQDTIPIRRIWPDGIFQFGKEVLQVHPLFGHQLRHRLQRGQDGHVPELFRIAQCAGHWLHHQDHHQQQAAQPPEL